MNTFKEVQSTLQDTVLLLVMRWSVLNYQHVV